jgi:hypothetical protein
MASFKLNFSHTVIDTRLRLGQIATHRGHAQHTTARRDNLITLKSRPSMKDFSHLEVLKT